MSTYNIFSYGAMMSDQFRMSAYRRALECHVKPGAVVVDIGAGQGIFSFIACELGASRVYAIELDDVINVARECAIANGFDERIHFIQQDSTAINLPEMADVIVSDLRGVLPFYSNHFRVIADARSRFLKPDGVLIPQCDRVFASLADAGGDRDRYLQGYTRELTGFDFGPALRAAISEPWKMQVSPERQVSEPAELVTVNYREVSACDFSKSLPFRIPKDSRCDGILLWFEATTSQGITFNTGPGKQTVYGQGLLPWPEPVQLLANDVVRTEITLREFRERPFWRWETQINRNGNTVREFDQSSLGAQFLSLQRLRELSEDDAVKVSR